MYLHVFQTDLPVLLHKPPRPVVGLYAAVACFYQVGTANVISDLVAEHFCLSFCASSLMKVII